MQVLQILAPVLCLAAMVLNLWSDRKNRESWNRAEKLREGYIRLSQICEKQHENYKKLDQIYEEKRALLQENIDRVEAIVRSNAEDIKAGRLWRTPFGVGAYVFFILPDSTVDGGLYVSDPHHVSDVGTRGFWTNMFLSQPDDIDDFTPWSEYGVSAFLSQEEAEAELERRKKECTY